jgi:hypothetical protein
VTPTVLRTGPSRFFFFSSDRQEPPHVHVERDANRAKFWLDPIELENGGGFGASELTTITGLLTEHREELLRAWHEFFTG